MQSTFLFLFHLPDLPHHFEGKHTLNIKIYFLVVIIFPFLVSCNLDTCGNDIYQRLDSKWVNRKVIKFSRSCGATTGSSIQISILPYDEALPNEGGKRIYIKWLYRGHSCKGFMARPRKRFNYLFT